MKDIGEILTLVESKFPHFKQVSEYKVLNNILCLSCYLDNESNYFILYPNGDVKYKSRDHWDYTSDFNKNLFGNGVVFIDLNNLEPIKIYYYKDDLNYDEQVRITYATNNFVVTEHEERTHVVFLDNFSVSSFGGWEYKIYDPYIIFFPYSGYSTYDTFAILDTNTKSRLDLSHKLNRIIEGDEYVKEVGWFFEQSISVDESRKNLLYQYQHSGEIFYIPITQLFNNAENLEYSKSSQTPRIRHSNLQILEGPWSQGISIDTHSVKSRLNNDGSFTTDRSYIGELLYQVKYRFDRTKIEELVEIISASINGYFRKQTDVLIPVPPSNQNRPFQPLYEIAKELSRKTKIPIDLKYILKSQATTAVKQIDNPEERSNLLKGIFNVADKKYKGKTILLFDDLYRSGITMTEIANTIKREGEVSDILALTITKTRTKR